MHIICRLIGHHRSRRRRRRRFDAWYSDCVFCGCQMKRVAKHDWRISA